MLLAEIHGKYDIAVRYHEDYLTSTVFSHLRYVAPGPFWTALFSRAKTVPINGAEKSLISVVGGEHQLDEYETLDVHFWPKCSGLGEPELAICFTGGSQQPLVVLVEVKLRSAKSGHGEHDQLKRYLEIAKSIERLRPSVPSDPAVVVVYLTPREALPEVQESLRQAGDTDDNRHRLFRLQWQDMIETIDATDDDKTQFNQRILTDVRKFLKVRQLEYFRGFRISPATMQLSQSCGSFFSHTGVFDGFQNVPFLNTVAVIKGEW